RTPKIQNVKGGGRDHWSQVYSVLMAGGGIARGRVVGKSDKIAGTVAERPVSPKDILATISHLLGIDSEMTLTDRTARPVPLWSEGKVIPEVLAYCIFNIRFSGVDFTSRKRKRRFLHRHPSLTLPARTRISNLDGALVGLGVVLGATLCRLPCFRRPA